MMLSRKIQKVIRKNSMKFYIIIPFFIIKAVLSLDSFTDSGQTVIIIILGVSFAT